MYFYRHFYKKCKGNKKDYKVSKVLLNFFIVLELNLRIDVFSDWFLRQFKYNFII